MLVDFSPAIRDGRLQAVKNGIDAGSGKGKMYFYTEPKPDIGDAITTQILVGIVLFSDPCGTVLDQVLTFAIDGDTQAVAEGDIFWCRITDSDDNFCSDLDCSITNGGGAVQLDALHAYVGGTIRVVSASFSEP